MAQIPLPKGIRGLSEFPKLKEYLINLMPTDEGIIRTPGIEPFAVGIGACRGAVCWSVVDFAYFVSGGRFLLVQEDATVVNWGAVSGTEDVYFSQGQVSLIVGVKGGAGYWYNPLLGLQTITDSDFLPSVDADFIDGRHVFIPADGSPAFYTNVDGIPDIDALSFFDAEELPDKNKCVINVKNQLYIGGSDSFEVFRTNVDPDAVFTRREGARVDVGFVGGKVRMQDTFAFLGRRRGEGYRFYAMGSGQAVPFSSEAVDEILNSQYTQGELEQCEGARFEYRGKELIVFTLARHSLAFIGGEWIYLDSDIDGTVTQWRAKGICHAYGRYLVGDRLTSSIGVLKDIPTEYGADVEFELQTFVRGEREANFTMGKLEVDCTMGKKSPEETIGLSVSRDGLVWSDYHYRGLGSIGAYRQIARWQPPGGIGAFENYCGIRLRSTGDVKFGLESIQYA